MRKKLINYTVVIKALQLSRSSIKEFIIIKALLYVFSECKCYRLEYLGWLSTSKRVSLLQSPNLRIFAQLLKYQTDSPRSGLESRIQVILIQKGNTT
jgi:hypothetical protein